MKYRLLNSWKVFWLLFVISFAARIYMFFSTYIIARDSVTYLSMTETFLEGKFFNALKFITPPLYPLLLAGMNLVINNPEITGKLVSLLAGTCVFFPLYYLGKRIFDQKVVFVGLFLFAIHPVLVRYSAEVLSESTFIFLSVAGFSLLWKGLLERRYIFCFFSGLILGLSCLTRAQGFIWVGVLLAVTIIFSFLQRKNRMHQGNVENIWIFSLLAVLGFFIVITPYAYFLKELTGEWTVRQGGTSAIITGTGHKYNQGVSGALLVLLNHPLLLLKKIAWNMGRLVSLLPETIYYPYFFFLMIGLVARKHTERHLQGELYLGIICLVYILGHCLLYLKVRYLLPIAPFAFFWAGQGVWVTVSWLQKLYARYRPRIMESHHRVIVTVFLICFIAASTLPKTLEPQRLTKLDRKEIGNKIAALFPEHPVVLASDERIVFYAKGQNVPYPKKIRTFAKFMEYAHNNKVEIIVMNKARINEGRAIGALSTDFFAHSDHPDLQLLFFHPSANQQDDKPGGSVFYVYRLMG
jgi:4-amino-4-deoxy-L-arabinose transferase-like glycosyltransferase